MLLRYFLTFFTFVFFFFTVASAQIPGSDTAELSLVPNLPLPNQTITARLSSYLADLNKAQISWAINGVTVDSGIGLKNFTFKLGPLGSRTELSVAAITSEGYPISRKVVLYPAKVDLIYEASSYTPPFYKGRAYFPYQGSAKIIALPSFVDENGQKIAENSLIFTWKDGVKTLIDDSGTGRSVLYYKSRNSLPRPTDITVEVTSLDDRLIARSFITLSPSAPKVLLYEESPLYGTLFNKALRGKFRLDKPELDIAAIPYFFGVTDTNSSILKYDWNINGEEISLSKNMIALKEPESGSGVASLSLQLSNTVNYFQFSNASLSIDFGSI